MTPPALFSRRTGDTVSLGPGHDGLTRWITFMRRWCAQFRRELPDAGAHEWVLTKGQYEQG
jgi:hypothetical protein